MSCLLQPSFSSQVSKKVFYFVLFLISCFGFSQNPINADYKGSPDGPATEYYLGGGIKLTCQIQNGNIEGDRYSFYKSGKIETKEHFDKGEFDGKNFSLTPDGDTIYVEIYKHDS